MARKEKTRPDLQFCKVTQCANPRAPWRLWFTVERDGKARRVFRSFASEDEAWREAARKELDLANHGIRFGELPPEARRAYDAFRDAASELADHGATVPPFERLVADALDAIRAAHNAREKNRITVAEAVVIFTDYKRTRVRERQLADLKDRLRRFAETFGTRPVRSITTAEIESWLASRRSRRNPARLAKPPLLGPQTRNHYRAALHAFFAHGVAAARGWAERNPVSDIEPETVETGEPEAYTPEDVAKIMQTALEHRPEVLPVLTLGFFAGLRVSEAVEIDVAKLPKQAGELRATGKTGPRMATYTEAAAAWMNAQPRHKGKVWQKSRRMLVEAMQELFALAKVEQIANGARHSFISYRTAETRDVARVADECGNSVGTIKNHYRQLVTAEAATAFFAIRPEAAAANVTPIQAGRARV
jgi:site-specific recombinase XerD